MKKISTFALGLMLASAAFAQKGNNNIPYVLHVRDEHHNVVAAQGKAYVVAAVGKHILRSDDLLILAGVWHGPFTVKETLKSSPALSKVSLSSSSTLIKDLV